MFSDRANLWRVSLASHTSLEMRRWWLFLIRTLTGLWTSSEDVPDAWSLSPSEPIFTFSWTIPTTNGDTSRLSGIALCFHSTQVLLTAFLFRFMALSLSSPPLSLSPSADTTFCLRFHSPLWESHSTVPIPRWWIVPPTMQGCWPSEFKMPVVRWGGQRSISPSVQWKLSRLWLPLPPPHTSISPSVHLINESRCSRQDCLLQWCVSKCGGKGGGSLFGFQCMVSDSAQVRVMYSTAQTVCVRACVWQKKLLYERNWQMLKLTPDAVNILPYHHVLFTL